MKRNSEIFIKPMGHRLAALLLVLSIFTVLPAGPVPVFVKKAVPVKKDFTLKLYGTFIHEEVSTIYSAIPGVVDHMDVKKGEIVKANRFLFTVTRDDPGFTRQKKKIVSPCNGIIKSIVSYQGTRVSPQSPVLVIAAFDPIYLYAEAAEADLGKIKPGDPVQIDVSYLDEPVPGTIVNLLDVDPAKKMVQLKIRVPNPANRVTAGTEGKIVYNYGSGTVILIPAAAVFSEMGRYYAWVKEDGKAGKKEIRIGSLTEKGFECLSGISAGQEIIYYGYLDLKPGDPVEAVESPDEH